MDERVKSIFDEREIKKQIEVAKYMLDQQLYDVEYIGDLDNKYISITTGKYIERISDMKMIVIREEDNKIVSIVKTPNTDEAKQYRVFVPLELSSDIFNKIVDGDVKKHNNELSTALRYAAIIFYVIAGLSGILMFALAIEEGPELFLAFIGSVMFIVFLGLVLHALSYILSNVISINKKIK